MNITQVLPRLQDRQDLTRDEATQLFDHIFDGSESEDSIAAFLLALHDKGECVDEIIGAAQSMRAHMRPIKAPPDAIDIVGTGGDKHGTFNVSTAAAFVVAAAGIPVAKHNNRAATSLAGSSDVLEQLGVSLNADIDTLQTCLQDIGLCFMFAPNHHPAMKYVAPVRRKLGVRTIFNLLGPLTNPAQVRRHMIGVFAKDKQEDLATALDALGSEAAWIVHGHDGMDEITTTGPTHIVDLHQGAISLRSLDPRDYAIPLADITALKGGDAQMNALAIRRLFAGEKGPYRDIVLLNAAAALVVAGKHTDIKTCLDDVRYVIDSGMAARKLDHLIALTHGKAFS